MIVYVSSGNKNQHQTLWNVNNYMLNTAKRIVDREVKDMSRPQVAYRPGEILNLWWPHCVVHPQLLEKTTEKRQKVRGGERPHVAWAGLEEATGKWHHLPALGKTKSKDTHGETVYWVWEASRKNGGPDRKCWGMIGTRLGWEGTDAGGRGPESQAEPCPQRKHAPT